MENLWILAQAGTEAPTRIGSEPADANGEATAVAPGDSTGGLREAPPRSGSPLTSLLPLILIFVVMYLLLLRGPRKQQQQQKKMVQSLKKNDRVRTIGGIYGTVADVRGEEVILKVDESTNTKIRVSASAIGKNLSQDEKE